MDNDVDDDDDDDVDDVDDEDDDDDDDDYDDDYVLVDRVQTFILYNKAWRRKLY